MLYRITYMPDNSYLKYYWLEKDFFPEIHEFFHNRHRHYLTPEHFFAIIFWKSIRPRELIKDGLWTTNKLLNAPVKKLTNEIFKAKDKEKLSILLKRRGFDVAMASAVLTVLYPKRFTIYDYRVWNQVKKDGDPKNISRTKKGQKLYFDQYIKRVLEKGRQIANSQNLSLRDCDRLLWAKSWHKELKNFLKIQPNSPRASSRPDTGLKNPINNIDELIHVLPR